MKHTGKNTPMLILDCFVGDEFVNRRGSVFGRAEQKIGTVPGKKEFWSRGRVEIFSALKKRSWVFLLLFGIAILGCQSESDSEEQSSTQATQEADVALSGEELARTYCQRCHAFPEPELLNRKTWEQVVLPRMGHRLGIYEGGERPDSLFESGIGGKLVREAKIYPKEAVLSRAKWEKMVEYFLDEAPDELPAPPDHAEIATGLEQFRLQRSPFRTDPPMTTMVEVGSQGNFFVGDAKGILTILGNRYRERFTMDIPSPPAAMQRVGNRYRLTLMGSVPPTDRPSGRIIELALRLRTKQYKYATIVDSLHRPVHTVSADLTGDGGDDLVVSEFGSHIGSLTLFENEGPGQFTRHVLRDTPGAIRSVVRDFDGDGRPDVMSLIAQGDEGIYLYHNEGEGTFREERVLRFPPAYGSTHFELADFNGDGAVDILYTAGDNADYPPVMKPYHGIRIFLNDGDNHFDQEYFFPLNGAYNATAHDFDGDGDLDIAAVSFFPDYENRPQESFVYLENTGDLEFEATTFRNSVMGRWLTLDSGDVDQDGDTDLLLGSFSALQLGTSYVPKKMANWWTKKGPAVVVLENTRISQ